MYRENYIHSLQTELIDMVEHKLTPVALKYKYSEVPLESTIKWRPVVLILGNYSSGKSTLINEYVGGDIQDTGQAPTDDSFTVITYDNREEGGDIRVTEEHDGRYLLNDPEYPFEKLKKYGRRFASHFRLKKVNSPFLKELAIIDTPGMLDSVTERDRGYNYQEVIGDLAKIADLILVLFDPHKAGTVQETYVALRETLPASTFEERILFVLNRIDECESMTDLLQVYGTLCWNLSQMTGRKDIPQIHLTYSSSAARESEKTDYLKYLQNQREELKHTIQKAPDFRLDHLATFVENHSENLDHFLETLLSYKKKMLSFDIKFGLFSLGISLILSSLTIFIMMISGVLGGMPLEALIISASCLAGIVFVLLQTMVKTFFKSRFHKKLMRFFDQLTSLDNQRRRDNWDAIKKLSREFLEKQTWRFSISRVKKEYDDVHQVATDGVREIREALNELTEIREERFGFSVPNEKTDYMG
ncbi:MAG: dynamin family protein [Proteobacteria bacterium]|nr:dynamin family protein [Pseudomonadota bacterium]